MDDRLTVEQLDQRWKTALQLTRTAVNRQPGAYRELKSMAVDIVDKPVDISDYMPAARKLVGLLEKMDPGGSGTIFHFFNDRITPSSIHDVRWLRLECKDLLAHLKAFDKWRLTRCRMQIVK
jgi:hypothetical protein